MQKPNYFQRRTKFQGPRTNHRIRSIDVQVINSNGENLGVLPLKKAIETAKEEGLDLIEYLQTQILQFVKLWIWVNINMMPKKKQI